MDQLEFGGKIYISSKRAAQISGYAKDYIGQLCRADKLDCKLVGRTWYVREESIYSHKRGVAEEVSTVEEGAESPSEPVEEIVREERKREPALDLDETPVAIRTVSTRPHGYRGAYTAAKQEEKAQNANLAQTRLRNEAEISRKTFVHRAAEPVHDGESQVAQEPVRTRSRVSAAALVGFVVLVAVTAFAGSLSFEDILVYTAQNAAQTASAIQFNPVYIQEALSLDLGALKIGFGE